MARALEFGWRRVTAAGAGPPAEQAETSALVARMTTAPSAARRGQIDALIAGGKADGWWAKLDWLCLLAAHDAQAARLNWVAAKSLSAVNGPVFTADRGYAGDGATAYLSLGEAYNATGNQLSQNSSTMGAWIVAASEATIMQGVGSVTTLLRTYSTTQVQGRANSSALDLWTWGGTGWTGHFAMSRTSATATKLYANGGPSPGYTSSAIALSADVGQHFRFGGVYSPGQIAATYSGAALSDAEMAALHGRLGTYLSGVGATP